MMTISANKYYRETSDQRTIWFFCTLCKLEIMESPFYFIRGELKRRYISKGASK
jgi:hypothetical protein